ncbi:MAG: WG repeat-containing protein [Candidatus Cryptobacteroides sp.]|nr:WG repeat-containing protein [Candidatus Cryptobacteroides sp.]
MASVCVDHLLPEEEQTDEIDYYSTYGYIDKNGREVTPCKYDEASDFHDGRALIHDGNDRYYFIDKNGREIDISIHLDNTPKSEKADDGFPF